MSELLDKVEQQKLIVTDSEKGPEAGKPRDSGSANSEHNASEAHSLPNSGNTEGRSSDSNHLNSNDGTIESSGPPATEAPKEVTDRSEIPFDVSAADTNVQKQHGEPNESLIERLQDKLPRTAGAKRHWFISSICMTLSLAVLSLSALDLRTMSEREGIVDSNFNVEYSKKAKNSLPDQMLFEDDKPSPDGVRVIKMLNDNNKRGYATSDGIVLVPPQYARAKEFQEGLGAVELDRSYTKNGYTEFAYIDKTNSIKIDKHFSDAMPFNDGVAAVVVDSTGALIDKTGKILIKSEHVNIPTRYGKLYEIMGPDRRVGLVDKSGKWVLKPLYDKIEPIEQTSEKASIQQFINRPQSNHQAPYLRVTKDGRCGVIDLNGNMLIQPKYRDISSFNKGVAAFEDLSGQYGFVDQKGKVLIPPDYDFVTAYDDIIAAKKNGRWLVLNSKNQPLPTKIDGPIANASTPWLRNGMAPFTHNNLCGYLDSKGSVRIEPKFEFAMGFSEGYAPVFNKGLWRFIDKNGNFPSKLEFSEIGEFNNGKAPVKIAEPLYTFIDANKIDNLKYNFDAKRRDFVTGFRGEL